MPDPISVGTVLTQAIAGFQFTGDRIADSPIFRELEATRRQRARMTEEEIRLENEGILQAILRGSAKQIAFAEAIGLFESFEAAGFLRPAPPGSPFPESPPPTRPPTQTPPNPGNPTNPAPPGLENIPPGDVSPPEQPPRQVPRGGGESRLPPILRPSRDIRIRILIEIGKKVAEKVRRDSEEIRERLRKAQEAAKDRELEKAKKRALEKAQAREAARARARTRARGPVVSPTTAPTVPTTQPRPQTQPQPQPAPARAPVRTPQRPSTRRTRPVPGIGRPETIKFPSGPQRLFRIFRQRTRSPARVRPQRPQPERTPPAGPEISPVPLPPPVVAPLPPVPLPLPPLPTVPTVQTITQTLAQRIRRQDECPPCEKEGPEEIRVECLEGFYEELPTDTNFIPWRVVNCVSRKKIRDADDVDVDSILRDVRDRAQNPRQVFGL